MPASKHLPSVELAARLRIAVGRVDRLLARQVPGADLTRSEFSILGAVVRQGEQRLGDLCDRERVNPTMLSRVVGALERGGWAERRADPADRRAVVVRPTAAGAALYHRLQRERSALIEEYLADRDDADRALIAAALPLLEELGDHLQRSQTARRAERSAG